MQRAHIGWMASIGGAAALVGGLLVLDPRLRQQANGLAKGEPSSELVSINAEVQDILFTTLAFLRDYSVDNAVLVIFALAAAVLVLFMLRT